MGTSHRLTGVSDAADLAPATIAVTAGRPPREPGQPLSTPPMLASVLHAHPADVGGADNLEYSREGNASFAAVEQVIGALEHGSALTFASGMAAVSASVAVAVRGRPGLVQPLDGYHGTRVLLAEATGLHVVDVDVTDTRAALDALPDGGALWVESPTNPLIGVPDIAALAEGVAAKGGLLVVDSTVATPVCTRPLDLGADLVVHSVTKYLSGHSDVILGAVVTRDEGLLQALLHHRTIHGAVPGPMNAFLAARGIRTLEVRMRTAMATAQVLAERLQAHPAVRRVHYPGLPDDPGHEVAGRQMSGGYGALMSFVLADAAVADAFSEALGLVVHATSLGGVETSLERRGRQHGEAHIDPGLVRMSVGIEDVDDVWADLERALAVATR